MNYQEFLDRFQKQPVKHYPTHVTGRKLVSVCVQTYQHTSFIKECLDGILKQKTSFDFEILLGEDDSTDGTREICIEYAKKYPDKIKLFLHHRDNNISISGQPTGRFNFSFNLFSAQGKYIAICEGDDYWIDPKKLQKQVDFLDENPNYVATFHGCKHVDEDNNVIKESRYRTYSDSSSVGLITANEAMITHTVVYRNIFKSFPDFFFSTPSGDTLLYHLLGFNGGGKFLENIDFSAYRVHKGGIWSGISSLQHIKNNISTLSTIKQNLIDKNRDELASKVETALAKRVNTFLTNLLLNKDFKHYLLGVKSIFKSNFKSQIILIFHFKSLFSNLRRRIYR